MKKILWILILFFASHLNAKETLNISKIEAKEWLKHRLESAKKIVIRTEKPDSSEKYGRILGTLSIDDEPLSLNEQLVKAGYAWAYDGGTKHKSFADLDEKRKAAGK
jgi:micrococcal nuclease